MAFCTKCGAQVADGTAFCTSCGNPMAAATPVTPVAPAPAAPTAPVSPAPAYAPNQAYAAPAPKSGLSLFGMEPGNVKDMIGTFGILGGCFLILISCFIPFYHMELRADYGFYTYNEVIKFNPLVGTINVDGTNMSFPFVGWLTLILLIVACVMVCINKKVPAMVLSGITAGYGFISFIIIQAMVFAMDALAEDEFGMSVAKFVKEYKDDINDLLLDGGKFIYAKGPTGVFLMLGIIVLIVGMIMYGTSHKRKTA